MLHSSKLRRGRAARVVAVAVAAGFLAGLAAGYALHTTAPRSFADSLAALQGEVRAVNRSLEAMMIEYQDALAGGGTGELAGALRHFDDATARFSAAEADLSLLDANATHEARVLIDGLRAKLSSRAPAQAIADDLDSIMRALRTTVGLS